MNISLGTCSDDPRVVSKSYHASVSFNGSLKNDCDIMNPTIRIAGSIGSVANCNYMYIPDFGRYYFITNIVSIANNLYEVSGKVDVLKSNASDIRASYGIANRNASNYDLYLDDGNFRLHANPTIVTKSFPDGFNFNNSSYLLMVSG